MVYPVITLYPSTETEFTTNGLGSLAEASSCLITEEANGSFELEMVYPIFGRRYNDLSIRRIIYVKPNPIDPPQAFRIYEISRPMKGLVTYYAAHISYDLSGYPAEPYSAKSCVSALSSLKANAVVEHPFDFWTDKQVTADFASNAPMPSRTILGGVQGSILDIYGGEYKFDNFLVRLYTHRGSDHGVTIRYGKNLTDLQQEENCAKTYSAILPYWIDSEDPTLSVQLKEKYIPTKGTHEFTNILPVDFSTEFEEKPTEDQLRSKATQYVSDNDLGVPKVSLTLSFAQLDQTEEYQNLATLERVELFDTIRVEFPEMNVSATAKVNKTVYDAIKGRYKSVTVGEVRSNISDTLIKQEDDFNQATDQMKDEMNRTKSDLEKAVENATKWITNGRGYMVPIRNELGEWMELCSLDTKDIDTAINVWRWNNAGFGHSSTGYDGPYTLAITQDGHIVADFITVGQLSANLIKSGKIQSKNGRVYFDLDGNEIACSRLITVDNSATKSVAQIGENPGITSDTIATFRIFAEGYINNALEMYSNKNGEGYIRAPKEIDIEVEDSKYQLMDTAAFIYAWPLRSSSSALYAEVKVSADDGWVGVAPYLRVSGDIFATKTIKCNGTKTRSVVTKHHGERLLYCYEMPSAMFGDIGEGITDECGECLIYLDDVFLETVTSEVEYQVFLQKEGEGDLWVDVKDPLYFLVKGTPHLRFSWEVKVVQKEYENLYLEYSDELTDSELDNELAFSDRNLEEELNTYDTIASQEEDIYMNQLLREEELLYEDYQELHEHVYYGR